MKKTEALSLIKSETEKGTSKEEIEEILLSQDKIGNTIPTKEYVAGLFSAVVIDTADEPEVVIDTADEAEQPKRVKKSPHNYEEWLVTLNPDDSIREKIRKIRDLKTTDERAGIMNRAKWTSVQGTIYHIKK